MMRETIIWGMMLLGCTVQALSTTLEDNPPEYMSKEDRETLKEEARDMFYHAYNAYMDNAYPADELMPLSCKGRYRGSEPDRGDIDSTLGNFSLTLVDTLDTLVVLGDLGEFENAVRLVVKDVTFDTDVIVSLFETNIRMLGGLLSGHILSEYLQSRADIMPWYRGELLTLAKDLGYRFLPAFNTTTGIPFGRINLRHGMKGVPAEMCRETCTACAGSMILEMAALSRLTGESVFEDKAQKAMDALWKMRHRGTDLMGSVLNVHSGDWVRRDSGVGAGIDSYYEYCLKAYILLGDEKYLGRFNKHYQAVMKYVSQGPMLLDVHMHRPNTNSKNFMDALLAFWPGLQVLKGDIKPAVETHEMLYQVMQRHNFIPEAFTTDFQVHWGHHPLRPEFLESTYFLYRATGDHYYLGVGRKVLKSLQTYARVACGYAAVSDVRTNKHDDTMDSFVLSETLKYLYLLFAEPNDLVLDLDEFIFTTEGHLLPLTLATARTNVTADLDRDIVEVDELGRTCPNSLHLFPASVRQPLRNMVEDVCPRRSLKRRLNASQFQANNLEHLKILSNMGITILTPAAGRVQVLHTFSNARTAQDAEEGLLFMQEMVELSKKQSQQTETKARSVTYLRTNTNPPREVTLLAGPAHFGPEMNEGTKITGFIEFASPSEACGELLEPEKYVGKVVMVSRGNCMFVEKARRIQKAGAIAGIVLDTVIGSSAALSPMFAMSGDGKEPDDVTIPFVFLFNKEATDLVVALIANDGSLTVTIGDYTPRDEIQLKAPGDLSVFERLKGSLKDFLTRQITPQNTASANRPVETPATMDISSTTEEFLPVEYEINDCPLKAVLYKKMDVIRIIKNDKIPAPTKNPKILSKLEKTWYGIKEDLVNGIYTTKTDSIIIRMPQIQLLYKTIHKLRRLEIIPLPKELSVPTMIGWFLKELCEVVPDLSLNDAPELSSLKFDENSNDDESSKASIDEFVYKLTKSLDANVLETLKKMEKNLNPEIDVENDEKDSLEEYLSIVSKLHDLNEQLKDDLTHQFEVDFREFSLSLLADMEKVVKGSSSSSERADLPSTGEHKNEMEAKMENSQEKIVSIGHLRGTIFEEKNTVKIDFTVFPAIAKNDPTNLEGFEQTWYDVRQHILNVMYSYDQTAVEIPIKTLELQFFTVQTLRGSRFDHLVDLENMVIWYLGELSEIRPDPASIENFTFSRTERESNAEKLEENPEKFAQRIADVFVLQEQTFSAYELPNSANVNEQESETRKDSKNPADNSQDEKIDRFNVDEEKKKKTKKKEDETIEEAQNVKSLPKVPEFTSLPTENPMDVATLAERAARINEAQSSRENDNNQDAKNRNTKISEKEEERKLKIIQDTRSQSRDKVESNFQKSQTIFEDKVESNFQKSQTIFEDDAVKEKIEADDPLEEFKKPLWASEDVKDSAKSFSPFEEKSEAGNRRYDGKSEGNYDHQSEFIPETRSSEKKTRSGNKRIDDDL